MPLSEPSPLAQQWARKYVEKLATTQGNPENSSEQRGIKAEAANRLLDSLRHLSLKAWSQTEAILADEIPRHNIDRRLVNPWAISQDTFKVYEKVLDFYTHNASYTRLPVLIAPDIARIRRKYTAEDPRVIAFVSMQFHYTGLLLRKQLSALEQTLLGDCFNVIDDHLYMPLHRAYSAAGKHDSQSPTLITARTILEFSTEISEKIVQEIYQMYPNYRTYSGLLSDKIVITSSQRDVVMFLIYLIVCILERSSSILQDELFPLCVMLYPKLNVHWEFIRQMLLMIYDEICQRLEEDQSKVFASYLWMLRDMFSPEVFYHESLF